jgi:hypothetical protein
MRTSVRMQGGLLPSSRTDIMSDTNWQIQYAFVNIPRVLLDFNFVLTQLIVQKSSIHLTATKNSDFISVMMD